LPQVLPLPLSWQTWERPCQTGPIWQ
jgi:hypothetical protein